MLSPHTNACLERGRVLFNSRQFWEAHEAWEEAWLEEDGDVRLLLQGLIQVAAGCFKVTVHKKPDAAVKLIGNGLEKIRAVSADGWAVDVRRFVSDVVGFLERVRGWQSGGAPAPDADMAPVLELT
jgi:uncharacterized protein